MFSWLEEKMTKEAEELFDLLYAKEFDKNSLRKALETGRFKPEDVNRATINYVQTCMYLRHGDKYDVSLLIQRLQLIRKSNGVLQMKKWPKCHRISDA